MLKGVTQNINFKVINQQKNDTCHVKSLEKDCYLGALGSFDYVFTFSHFGVLVFLFMGDN
jgi:hypothetical protein